MKRADERLARLLKSSVDIPSLPEVVRKLIEAIDNEVNPRNLGVLIGTDQGLTVRVLRLANSAFYSLRTPMSSLRHAATLLGTRTLKSLALSVSIMNLVNRSLQGFELMAFWRHSMATAVTSQRLGALVLPELEEDLYVAGLLHDCGVALMAQHLAADYPLVLKLARTGKRTLSEIEEEIYGASHGELGCTLATRWRFPGIVCEGIKHHETQDAASAGASAEALKLIDLVRFADQWTASVGLDFLLQPGSGEAAKPTMPAWVSLTPEELEGALADIKDEIASREEALFPKAVGAPA